MPWYFYLSISVICFTALNLLQRVIAVESANPRVTSIIFNLYAATFTIIINIFLGTFSKLSFPNHPKAWIVLASSALCYGLYERGRFFVAKALDASTNSLVGNIATPVSFIGSVFLYQEKLTTVKIIGFIIIMIAILLATYEKSTKKSTLKGIGLGLLVGSVVGLAIMIDKLGTQIFQPSTWSILLWTVPLIFILPPFPSIKSYKKTIKEGSWKTPVLAGFNAIAFVALLYAYQKADATLIISIGNSTIPTVILAAILLKETKRLPQKLLAAILSVLGIFLLVK